MDNVKHCHQNEPLGWVERNHLRSRPSLDLEATPHIHPNNHLTSWFIYIHLIWSRFIQGWINDVDGYHGCLNGRCMSMFASQRDGPSVVWFVHWDLNPDFHCLRINPATKKPMTHVNLGILEKSWETNEQIRTFLHIFKSGFKADFRKLSTNRWLTTWTKVPNVHGRIHIIEIPFVGWELSIGVHKPQHSAELGKSRSWGKEGKKGQEIVGLMAMLGLNMLDGLQQANIYIYIYIYRYIHHHPSSIIIIIIIIIMIHYHPLSIIIHYHPILWACHPPWDVSHPNLSEVRRRNCSCALKDAETVSWILMKSWTWRANLIILIIQWLLSNINGWLSW